MNLTLVNKYTDIWQSLDKVNPLKSETKLRIHTPNNNLININNDT